MTEYEWRACTDPTRMLEFLRRQASARQLRLFACGCGRRVWERLDAAGRWAVEAAERFVDGTATAEELGVAFAAAQEAALATVSGWGANRRHDPTRFAAASAALPDAAVGAIAASHDLLRWADEGLRRPAERVVQVGAIQCVFGDPFRRIVADPNWLTTTVLALARRVYEAREFDTLPILADALQDAGCDDEELLAHCRSGGPHCRGCWPVDLVLGKE